MAAHSLGNPRNLESILESLRKNNPVSDLEFDQIYSDPVQALSEQHWTQVAIAKRAAQLLVVNDSIQVLDVGSGAGKFCLIGALTTRGHFFGIEQRPSLVQYCRGLAEKYGIERATFLQGDIRDVDWTRFQSFYLYNPFVENIYRPEVRIDEDVELGEEQYVELVNWTQKQLHALPVGTRVATYHGFGGDMPPGYQLFAQEPGAGDYLRLWIKTKSVATPPNPPGRVAKEARAGRPTSVVRHGPKRSGARDRISSASCLSAAFVHSERVNPESRLSSTRSPEARRGSPATL